MKQKNKNKAPRARSGFHFIRGRTIFAKYMITCISVILLSFIFLGTVVTVFSINYSNADRNNVNERSAKNLANLMTQYYTEGGQNQQTIHLFISYAGILTDQTGALVCMADKGGSVFTLSQKLIPFVSAKYMSSNNANIPGSIMKSVLKASGSQPYSEIDTLGGFYTKQFNTVAIPFYDGDQAAGAVFVSSPANNLMSYMYEIIRIFLLCIALTIFFSFVILYFLTAKMVRPLRQMSVAAKSFSKGDFTVRVPVDNNDEVGQLAAAFNNMASSLTTLEETRRIFVANVSHELKTPMTSIAGFIDGILDGTIPAEKQEYYLSIVSNEVKRLSRLVRSFLEISRIEAGELKITPSRFSVTETVRRVVVGFEYAVNDKQLEVRGLDTDKEYYAFADPDIIHQVIYNLVDNAIKFSDTGGYLEVNVAGSGDKIYVGVKNSGMGIPAEDLPYVFDRFYKTDKSRSSDRKGVGLGLYIVKTVLNMQEQDISVKSVEGEYCEFVFTLAKA